MGIYTTVLSKFLVNGLRKTLFSLARPLIIPKFEDSLQYFFAVFCAENLGKRMKKKYV